MVLFGGSWCKGGPYSYSNETFVLDMETMTWSDVQTHGTAPTPRSQHGACLIWNRFMLVVGGYCGDWLLNDIFCLDLERLLWHKVQPVTGDEIPPAIHTVPKDFRLEAAGITCSVLDDDRVLIHGINGGGVYLFGMSNCTLQKISTQLPELVAHVSCQPNNNQIVVFSGVDKKTGLAHNTLFKMDLQ